MGHVSGSIIRWGRVWALIWLLAACDNSNQEELRSCDFTEKLVNQSIDQKPQLLTSPEALYLEREAVQELVEKAQVKAEDGAALYEELGVEQWAELGEEETLSKKGKVGWLKLDLLERMKDSYQRTERQLALMLYNQIRWPELITDRAYVQECPERIVVTPEKEPYAGHPLDRYLWQEHITEIGQKNLYWSYATPEERQILKDSARPYRFAHQKTGEGFSLAFFVEDVQNHRLWKAKVGWESYREPLAASLSWALGFYVDRVFHMRDVRVEYNENLEEIFKDEGRRLEDSLSALILKDGRQIELIATPETPDLDVSGLYRQFRREVRYLVFKALSFEPRSPHLVRVGQWDFDALGNYQARTVRVLGLWQFWLENVDIKSDNNRILFYLNETPDEVAKHPLTFKNAPPLFYGLQWVVHDLGLSFTANPSSLSNDLKIERDENGQLSFRSLTRERDVYAWRLITEEDAMALAERLAQLTETQFRQAVAAAGYPYPALVLLVEKLKSRRNYLLKQIAGDRFAPLPADPEFISNASAGEVDIGEGATLFVPQDGFVLQTGRLINDIDLGHHGLHSEMIRE